MSNKGKYNRYLFLKKMNRKSIILIKGKNKYYSYGRDLDILKHNNERVWKCTKEGINECKY